MSKTMVQVKFTIESGIVSVFKARCASQGVSMASVISHFMETGQPIKAVKIKTDTRPQRKTAWKKYILQLEELLDMEEQYRDAIPENFTSRFESSEHACNQLSEALSYLEEAYL